MSAVATTEMKPVANKAASPSPPPSAEPPFERIEFQAPIGFSAGLDRARRKRGLSRSAYIRQAVLLLIEEDTRGRSRS